VQRREFLASGLAAAAAFGLGQRAAGAATPLAVLRLGVINGLESPIGVSAAAFAEAVAANCGGRVRVDIYPAGEAGGEAEMFKDMRAGALEMVFASSDAYASAATRLGVFDIPFLFRDVAHARGVLDSEIGKKALDQLDLVNVVGLAWGENGLRHLTTSDRAVRTPADLDGLKLRVPESLVLVRGFKALGADAETLPLPQLYEALASGRFQAQENPLTVISDLRFDRVQKFLCLTGHVYSPALIMISKGALASLSPDDAQAVRDAAALCARQSRSANEKAESSAIGQLRDRGMTVVDDIDRAAFVAGIASAQEVYENSFGKAQIAAIRNWKA